MRRISFGSLITGAALGGAIVAGMTLRNADSLPKNVASENVTASPGVSDVLGVQRISNFSSWDRVTIGVENEDVYEGNIILSSVVTYSDYFSRAYGYPAELINEGLPDYIDFLAYEIKYAGSFQRCRLKLLVDKESVISLEGRSFFNVAGGANKENFRAALPRKTSAHSEKPYQREFRLNSSSYSRFADYALNNFFLFGRGKNGDQKSFASVSFPVVESNPDVFSEWVYISLGVGCTKLGTNILSHDEVYLALPPSEAGVELSEDVQFVGSKIVVPLPKKFQQDVLSVLNKISFEIR